jgi:hypothetical protein
MPDTWETQHGLNPADPADGRTYAPTGYTWTEEYINSLVSHITDAQNEGGILLTGQQTSGLQPVAAVATPRADATYTLDGRTATPARRGVVVSKGRKHLRR